MITESTTLDILIVILLLAIGAVLYTASGWITLGAKLSAF